MAEKEVKVSYGALKTQALEYYMQQEGNKVEDALKEHLDKLYQKNVPKPVQDFLEKGPLDPDTVAEQESSHQEQETVPQVAETAAQPETAETPEAGRASTNGRQSRTTGRSQSQNGRAGNRRTQQESDAEAEQTVTADAETEEHVEAEETQGPVMSM